VGCAITGGGSTAGTGSAADAVDFGAVEAAFRRGRVVLREGLGSTRSSWLASGERIMDLGESGQRNPHDGTGAVVLDTHPLPQPKQA
jgi:hypothetical protein